MDTKRCFRCKESKPFSDFGLNRRERDGFSNECKECKRERDKAYRDRPEIRIERSIYGKAYRESIAENDRKKYPRRNYPQCIRAWHARNPDAQRAYRFVDRAIKNSILQNARSVNCVMCGRTATEYHHRNGYSDGHELDVIPLCRSCHRTEHSHIPK